MILGLHESLMEVKYRFELPIALAPTYSSCMTLDHCHCMTIGTLISNATDV
jgi:hypothetical protein